ncbi:hypothetical protein LP419_09320 [Massilia sp. H-1]|nr:hypothetical protein LP419_09320 [Massilia sp. H-1]
MPYHSVETLMVEAPDYGHETTSEAYSFWLWLEAQYGRSTGDWGPLNAAWANMEKYIIPAQADQPTNSFYNPGKLSHLRGRIQAAPELPCAIGQRRPGRHRSDRQRTAKRLRHAQHLRHALADGRRQLVRLRPLRRRRQQANLHQHLPARPPGIGVGNHPPSFVRDIQMGPQRRQPGLPEPVHRRPELRQTMALHERTRRRRAPVQAIYWASVWAKAQGKSGDVADLVKKAAKMGDYLRYAMFDKYFKKVGNCVGAYACPGGSGATDNQGMRDNQHYLMSWYYAWGGATDTNSRLGLAHRLQPQPLRLPESAGGLGAVQPAGIQAALAHRRQATGARA